MMTMNETKNNSQIDLLKFIMSICVVSIHVNPVGGATVGNYKDSSSDVFYY